MLFIPSVPSQHIADYCLIIYETTVKVISAALRWQKG